MKKILKLHCSRIRSVTARQPTSPVEAPVSARISAGNCRKKSGSLALSVTSSSLSLLPLSAVRSSGKAELPEQTAEKACRSAGLTIVCACRDDWVKKKPRKRPMIAAQLRKTLPREGVCAEAYVAIPAGGKRTKKLHLASKVVVLCSRPAVTRRSWMSSFSGGAYRQHGGGPAGNCSR